MSTSSPDDNLELARTVFEQRIPFNQVLGLNVVSLDPEGPVIAFDHRPELVGNSERGILHGGVISATLDTVGGLAAFLSVLQRHESEDAEERRRLLARLGTIDLRIDYLRSGRGRHFRASAHLLRTGSKVAVTRMELLNEEDVLIAVGTGTYIVG